VTACSTYIAMAVHCKGWWAIKRNSNEQGNGNGNKGGRQADGDGNEEGDGNSNMGGRQQIG
jgi:hypothetical protein